MQCVYALTEYMVGEVTGLDKTFDFICWLHEYTAQIMIVPIPGQYNILVTAVGCVPVNDEFYSAQTSLVTT